MEIYEDMERSRKRADATHALVLIGTVGGWLVSIGVIGFGVWVVVKVLSHFAII